MTVAELVAKLGRFPPGAEVLGTWKGVIREIDVYQAKSGEVLIDADEGYCRHVFESGEVAVKDRR